MLSTLANVSINFDLDIYSFPIIMVQWKMAVFER